MEDKTDGYKVIMDYMHAAGFFREKFREIIKLTAYELSNSHLHLLPVCTDLDFDWNTSHLARSSLEGAVSIIDVETGEIVRSHHCQKYGIHSLKFLYSSPDVSACSGNDNSWRLWDFSANKFICVFRGSESLVTRLECHKSENIVASQDSLAVSLWDTRCTTSTQSAAGCSSPSFDHRSGRVLAVTCQKEESVRLYDIRAFHKPFSSFNTQQDLKSSKLSFDGNLIACTTSDRVFLIDAFSGSVCWYSPCLSGHPRLPCFNWNATLVACAVGCDAVILDASSGKILQTLKGHGDEVMALFSPKLDLIVTSATALGFWTPRID